MRVGEEVVSRYEHLISFPTFVKAKEGPPPYFQGRANLRFRQKLGISSLGLIPIINVFTALTANPRSPIGSLPEITGLVEIALEAPDLQEKSDHAFAFLEEWLPPLPEFDLEKVQRQFLERWESGGKKPN